MYMTLPDYETLSVDMQAALLGHDGVRVATAETNGKTYHLYNIFDFYVEVEITQQSETEYALELFPFVHGSRLDKYLDGVDLADLLDCA